MNAQILLDNLYNAKDQKEFSNAQAEIGKAVYKDPIAWMNILEEAQVEVMCKRTDAVEQHGYSMMHLENAKTEQETTEAKAQAWDTYWERSNRDEEWSAIAELLQDACFCSGLSDEELGNA